METKTTSTKNMATISRAPTQQKKKDKTELEQGQMSISQKRTHTSVQWPWHSISAALIRDGSLKMMRRAQRLEGLASVGDQSQIRLLSPRGFVQSRVVAIAWNEKKKVT